MKKYLRIIVTFLLVAMLIPQSAQAGEILPSIFQKAGDLVDWEMSADGTLTLKGRGEMYATVQEWTAYPNSTTYLELRSSVRTVVMERKEITFGSITTLSQEAFKDASNLSNVTLADGLISIGANAFENCTSLTDITFPTTLTTIEKEAFLNASLTDVLLPASVTSIGEGAFAGNRFLTAFRLDSGNTAFKTENGILYNSTMTKLVAFPSGKLANKVRVNKNAASIGTAFRGASRIGEVILNSNITKLEEQAFEDSSLTGIRIPASVALIGNKAFRNCQNLSYVAFGPGIIFGEDVFEGCTGLQIVYYSGTEEQWYADGCEDLFSGMDVIIVTQSSGPPCAHAEQSDWIVDRAAGIGVQGLRHKECLDCGEITDQDVLEASVLKTPVISVKQSTTSPNLIVSWDAVQSASKYRVYRSDSLSGSYVLKNTVTTTSWEDKSVTPGIKYYYKVRAVYTENEAGNSSLSSAKSKTSILCKPTVDGTTVASTGNPKVQWDAVEGAKNYKIYRATSKSGTYSLKTTTTKLYYTDSSATKGKTYYYKVVAAADNSNGNSAKSAAVKLTAKLPQTSITKITYLESTGKPKITWGSVKGATAYLVYRSSAKNGTYIEMEKTTSLSYTDEGARPGYKYFYKVAAVADSVVSAKSSAKGITCHLARTTLKLTTVEGKPNLKWSIVRNADGYKIYRATSKDGDYSLVKTTTEVTWKDTKAKAGTTYYYKIKAIYDDNTTANSAYSLVKSIKCTK